MHFATFLVGKLIRRQTPFGSAAFSTHATATAMHFPANGGLMFLTDELTNGRCLVDTGATLSIVPCSQYSSPSGPLLKGADCQPIPSCGFIKKTVQFQCNFLHQFFCKPLWLAPFWELTFKENSKSLFLQKSAKYSSLVQQRFRLPIFCLQRLCTPCFFLSSSTTVPAPVLVPPPPATTSSQPPAISAYLVRNSEVKLSSFSFRENQSLLDSPPSYKKIPDSVPDDVKTLLQKFPSILRTGDVKPAPNHGFKHHIHIGSHR
jgi:hypothetical protein